MVAHHILGPSGLDRITNCIGSLYGPPVVDDGNEFSREGTACHAFLEFCLSYGADPRTLLGSTDFSAEFPVTDEMVEAVELFTSTIKAVCDEFNVPHDRIKSEEKLVSDQIPNELFGGTMDCQVAGDDVLIIGDLKFGRRQVFADSMQLTAYSLLSLSKLGRLPKKVVQLIIQPRAGVKISRHEPGTEELTEVWGKIGAAAEYIMANPNLIADPSPEMLNAGEWCKYCKRREGCPAREALVTLVVTEGTLIATDGELKAIPTQGMSTERLAWWLDHEDVIKEFLADVEKALRTRASMGEEIPGRKLVLSYGHRKWVDAEEVMLKRLPRAKLGLTAKDLKVTKIVSPAQAEKVLKDKGVWKDVKDLFTRQCESKPTGVRLVKAKARGEAIRPETAKQFLSSMKEESDDE